jgi:hypothetical protein
LPCGNCRQSDYVFINLNDSSFEGNCPCGEDLSGSLSNDITTGFQILYRSNYELLERKDWSLTIVFSATAMDSELSRLYFKWKKIGAASEISDETLEKALRSFRTVDSKFEEVAKLMSPKGLTGFIKSNAALKEIIEKGFPSLSIDALSKSFQTNLFWPRNRILHLGKAKYTQEDARRCFNFASLGLRILESLDNEKRDETRKTVGP